MFSFVVIAVPTISDTRYFNAENVESVTLLDFSRAMLEEAKPKKDKRKDELSVKLRVGSTSDLKFPDETFDTVVDTFGICSYDEPEKALGEMARVLKTGGRSISEMAWVEVVVRTGAKGRGLVW